MSVIGIIPARYASTRFPGKPLADIRGKSMVQRVYEQASKAKSLARVIVATDHEQIHTHVTRFGGEVILTRKDHPSGTDRCREVLSKIDQDYEFVINIQGDEPFIHPEQIDELAAALNHDTQIATLIKGIEKPGDLENPGVVKVVIDKNRRALYFSRSAIPHLRNVDPDQWLPAHRFFKHIGMYLYRSDILMEISALPPSVLERAESLEQLRWLESGYRIDTVETTYDSVGIDSPEDLAQVLEEMKG